MSFYKVSFSKLCRDLNMSGSNISRWKNGTKPTLETLVEVADYLQCSIDDLLDLE